LCLEFEDISDDGNMLHQITNSNHDDNNDNGPVIGPEHDDFLVAADHHHHHTAGKQQISNAKGVIVWRNVFVLGGFHLGAMYGLYLCFSAKLLTLLFAFSLYYMGGLGITAGSHRLWAHRSYKARFPLRCLLAIFQTLAFQNDIYEWSRDHRVHHKFSETDADPHNATRGFFFSHMGWLVMKKHKDVITKGKDLRMDDLMADPVVRFQRKHYLPLVVLICFGIPTVIPWLLWGESLWYSYFICGILRYVFTLHCTWLVNSIAHSFGMKPYDTNINPSENLFVSIGAIGEGFHNYHHTFPYDYSTSEFGFKYFNFTTGFINLMAAIGLAYDRKKVSPDVIKQRRQRTGDLNVQQHQHQY